ncbi:hybrid sensor histidine kinase/response regulator [Sinobacterium caligoides]|nr:hybrid sensor histidine kinase/response regulator [Sinobacterium caligoides]
MSVYSLLKRSIFPLLAVLLSYTLTASGANAIGFQSDSLIDSSHQLTLADLHQNDRFTPLGSDRLHAGLNNASYWLRIYPEHGQSFAAHFLNIDYPPLDRIEILLPDQQGKYHSHLFDDNIPITPLSSNTATQYTLQLNEFVSPELPVYIKVTTSSSVDVPVTILDQQQLLQQLSYSSLIYGVYFGVLSVMALYNLFIYCSTRDESYLLYVLYIVSFSLMQTSITGHGYRYLWPTHPELNAIITPFLMSISCFCAALFSRSFLQTKQHLPSADKLLIATAFIAACTAVSSFFLPYSQSTQLSMVVVLIFTIQAIATGALCYYFNVRIAKYFLLGWCCISAGACIVGLTAIGLLPANWLTRGAGQIGSAIEVIALSLALADRLNQLQREKSNIKKQAHLQALKANQELSNALSQLEQSNQVKNRFLSTLSHELRTPITGIAGSLALIDRDNLPVRVNRYLNSASKSTRQLQQQIEALLQLSDSQSEHFKPHQHRFDLHLCLQKISDHYTAQCEKRQLEFSYSTSEDTPQWVFGDQSRLELILQQLFNNAVKFTEQGSIRLNVSAADGKHNKIVFCLTDTGCGISESEQQRLFNAFEQADNSASRRHEGLGIGLDLCHQLTQHLSGDLRLHSEQGVGSSFTLCLPLPAAPEHSYPSQETRSLSILVAEDNAVNRMILKAQLKQLGHNVDCVYNGQHAFEVCLKQRFDIIFMDCQMPIVDGYVATHRIKQNGLNRQTPIVAVTANTMTNDLARCHATGMQSVLAKPTTIEQLQSSLQRWVGTDSLYAQSLLGTHD